MERDEETGLALHGARYYAAWLGRWTAGDPIGLGDGVNRYAYCGGNPVGCVDRDGTKARPTTPNLQATARELERRLANVNERLAKLDARDAEDRAQLDAVEGRLRAVGTELASLSSRIEGAARPTDGEYWAAEVVRAQSELESEDSTYYGRVAIADFIPGIGLYDIRHDAGQLGAAIEMGDEARAVQAGRRIALDVVSTFADVMTLGADRLVAGWVSRALRGSGRLYAHGGVGSARSSLRHVSAADIPTTNVGANNVAARPGGGRAGGQQRLREIAQDPNTSSANRGWIQQELNSIARGQRTTIRNPPGKQLAHTRGREAAKGYDHVESPSNLQETDLHRAQHKFDDFGRKNRERP